MSVLDDSCEGILWLKLCHKSSKLCILPCVCYLPPENSSRFIDVNTFYDSLLTDIYKYQGQGILFVCGDFNSRCGDLDDFIRGIDKVCEREIIDFSLNKYGKILIDFLINTNMCILNGRSNCNNDFTSVSTNGHAVVDYCFVNHVDLNHFSNFSVTRASELLNKTGDVNVLASTKIPDHSLLKWNIDVSSVCHSETADVIIQDPCYTVSEENVRFDLANIPENFLIDDLTLSCVNDTITKLESSMRTQSDIDTIYNDWCNILKNHMLKSIPHKTVKRCSTNDKPHRPAKPWWSEKLSDLWVGVCRAEKLWLSCQSRNHKQKFKSEFTHLR